MSPLKVKFKVRSNCLSNSQRTAPEGAPDNRPTPNCEGPSRTPAPTPIKPRPPPAPGLVLARPLLAAEPPLEGPCPRPRPRVRRASASRCCSAVRKPSSSPMSGDSSSKSGSSCRGVGKCRVPRPRARSKRRCRPRIMPSDGGDLIPTPLPPPTPETPRPRNHRGSLVFFSFALMMIGRATAMYQHCGHVSSSSLFTMVRNVGRKNLSVVACGSVHSSSSEQILLRGARLSRSLEKLMLRPSKRLMWPKSSQMTSRHDWTDL
jgi:hypothetical protein